MRSLIIPDIHNRLDIVDEIIKHVMPDEVIFLGDYFDQFDDSPEDAEKTARWVKRRLHLKGYYFIMGNHESQYRWPKCPWHKTAAGSRDKQEAIDSVLTKEDWAKMLFAVQRENWWFTHAGLHPRLFMHPVMGFSAQKVWDKLHEAEFQCEAGLYTRITDEQHHEGEMPSGPLWLRWQQFEPILGINQVVGHTPGNEPRILEVGDSGNQNDYSFNMNLDTANRYYAILQNNKLVAHKTLAMPKA